MFPVLVQRTSNSISAILNHKWNYVEIIFLRLYKRSYCRNSINCTWDKNTIDTCQRNPKEYKHLILCRKYSNKFYGINEDLIPNLCEPEHKILHLLFENSVHYKDTVMQPLKANMKVSYDEICKLYLIDWNSASMSHIYDSIKTISHSYLNGTRFETSLYDGILQGCSAKLDKLPDEELKILMKHLIVISSECHNSPYWQLFLKELNAICLKRFFPSTVDKMLFICDAFYQLGDNNSNYSWRAMRKLLGNPSRLFAKQLIQSFFILNSLKSNYNAMDINMFEVECRTLECISDISGNELGILARGFFLSKRRIRTMDLRTKIITKTKTNIKFMDSHSIGSVMKLIRYTACSNCMLEFQDLLESLHAEIPRLSLKCLVHIAHAFGGMRVYNEQLTKCILERFKNEITAARLKDIERILFAITSVAPYNNYYQEVCQILLNEIVSNYQTVRLAEVDRYPLSLVRIVTYFTARNIYEPQLLEYVLDPMYIQNLYKNNKHSITSDMFMLDSSVKIEFPDYKGPFLTEKIHNYLTKKYLCNNDNHGRRATKFRTEIVFACKRYLGINVYVDYILPHFIEKDVVFGFDKHNNSVEVESILSSTPAKSIKYVNTENLNHIRWYILQPVRPSVKVLGHNGYIGYIYRKIKQLKAIGYTPIMIDEDEWNLYTEEKDKENYLRSLIYEKHHFQNLLNSNSEECDTTIKIKT